MTLNDWNRSLYVDQWLSSQASECASERNYMNWSQWSAKSTNCHAAPRCSASSSYSQHSPGLWYGSPRALAGRGLLLETRSSMFTFSGLLYKEAPQSKGEKAERRACQACAIVESMVVQLCCSRVAGTMQDSTQASRPCTLAKENRYIYYIILYINITYNFVFLSHPPSISHCTEQTICIAKWFLSNSPVLSNVLTWLEGREQCKMQTFCRCPSSQLFCGLRFETFSLARDTNTVFTSTALSCIEAKHVDQLLMLKKWVISSQECTVWTLLRACAWMCVCGDYVNRLSQGKFSDVWVEWDWRM